MREDLALMGENVSEDNYCLIILGSLSTSFDVFLMSIMNQISPLPFPVRVEEVTVGTVTIPTHDIMFSPPKITPDDLMEIVGQEAEHRALQAGNSKKDKKDAAFVVSDKSKGGKRGKKSNIECFNCKKQGHIKAECWAKGGVDCESA